MPVPSGDPDLAAVLTDLGMVGSDGTLQRVVRLAAYGLIRREGRNDEALARSGQASSSAAASSA